MYSSIQELLLKAARIEDYEAEVKHVTEFYASDLNAYQLKTMLQVFRQTPASKLTREHSRCHQFLQKPLTSSTGVRIRTLHSTETTPCNACFKFCKRMFF